MSQPGGSVVPVSSVPPIYSPHIDVPRLNIVQRVVAAIIGIVTLMPLCVASRLTPNPNGVGTHTQIRGLTACPFEARYGIPCPSCGMTTSFAYFSRGNIVASFYIQPMGCVLAALSIMVFWFCLYLAISGRAVHRQFDRLPMNLLGFYFISFGLGAWAWKIIIHITHHDGW
jgi:hypothetical protein